LCKVLRNYIANFKDVIIIYKGEEINYYMLYKNILRTNLFKENQSLNSELYKDITEYIFTSPHKFFQIRFNKTKFKRGLYVRIH